MPLNGIRFIEAKQWLKQFDNSLEEDVVGVTSYKLGIGLYAPDYDEDEEPEALVEAVIVFKKAIMINEIHMIHYAPSK
ncbi:hypothetical protein [Paenibacillus anseongense]|uniref:hypothetical protein n=1 Tax=Paenibacillus anseongense TaxID=2682845 RepID=UPI002DB6656E|nr:hypothetical protein [Paenibacillus anseongense]MEC0264531.1 hypothetical protein [Paenibacillus anseongense]